MSGHTSTVREGRRDLRDRDSIRWSLIVMRGPGQRVRQFRIRRRFVYAAPAALLLLFAAILAALQLHAAWQLDALRRELIAQSARHRETIAAKDGQIRALEAEMRALSDQQGALEKRLEGLRELERRLERFFDRYGEGAEKAPREPDEAADESDRDRREGRPGGGAPDADDPDGLGAATDSPGGKDTSTADSDAGAPGGADAFADRPGVIDRNAELPESPEATAALMIRMMNADEPDFRALSGMVDELERSMALRLEAERLKRMEAAALPSAWPTRSRRITSTYGYRRDPFTGETAFHDGIDISGRKGDPVYAAGNGTVEETGFDGTRGRFIVIAHLKGLTSRYYHLSSVGVEPGDTVKRGDRIGALGSTGRSTGPHLHFAVWKDGESVNPLEYLELVKEE